MGLINEFKTFAIKGNVVDMAVGIIIGSAFGKIVSSFVGDILMPPLGLLLGGMDFKDLRIVLKEAIDEKAAVTLNYGNFIQITLDFLIIALAVFLFIKAINSLKKKEKEVQPVIPEPTKEEILLTEIRDILKSK
ncbi:MAG: large-conductance mechanosensitive channel protein MscL [Candidatus Kapaibacteriota bacterium]